MMWEVVRAEWQIIFSRNTNLQLASKVKNKRLYEHLFILEPTTEEKTIIKIINSFVKEPAR